MNVQIANRERAAAAIIVSIFFYGIMDASSKLLLPEISANQILFCRNAIIVVGTTIVILVHSPQAIRTNQPLLQIGRSLVGNTAVLMFIISFGLMQLSQVVAVSFLTPVFAVVWDIVLFRSKTTWRQLLPALLGLIGVWFVLRPGLDVPLIHAIVPFLASGLNATVESEDGFP